MTREQMRQARLSDKQNELIQCVNEIDVLIGTVKALVILFGDIEAQDLADARNELVIASNAIDDAMRLIDELLAPEPTREEVDL